MNLERGADHEQEPGGTRQRVGAVDRARGQQLAEKDDVGLQNAATLCAKRHVGSAEQRKHLVERVGLTAAGAAGRANRAVHLQDVLASCSLVEPVDVLRDHSVEESAL